MSEQQDAHALHEAYIAAAGAYSAFTSQFWSNLARPNPNVRPMRAADWAETTRLMNDRDLKHDAWLAAANATTDD